MLAAAALVWLAVERVARRLLPLAALLRLSLALPDQTASRYRIALRAGTTRQLREVVDDARAGRLGTTPAESAERVLLLVAALNAHDRLTRGHSERVRAYAEVIGEQLGLPRGELDRLRWAALLHDVGKIAVPAEILNKRGRLTDEEFEAIKTHPAEGARLVEPLREWLGDAVDAVGQHHERWDGRGYPSGLDGTDIGLAARIVAVADTFDVITSSRSYKRAMSPTAARREIARCAGSQFDPRVTRALIDVSLGKLWLAGGPMSWAASLPVLSQVPAAGGVVPALGNAAVAGVAAATVVTGGLTGPAPDVALERAAAVEVSTPATAGDPVEPRDPAGADTAASTGAATPVPGATAEPAVDPAAASVGSAAPPAAASGPEVPDGTDVPAASPGAAPPAAGPQVPGVDAPTAPTAPSSGGSPSGGLVGGIVDGVVGSLPLVDGEGITVDAGQLPVVGDLPVVGGLPPVTVPPVTVPPALDGLLGGLLGRR
jgi:putative nucleotidyltransferase with HDIG domain